VYFIPHGLDTSGWLPVQQERVNDGLFRIGYLGQLENHKGVHLVIEAVRQLKENCSFELLIYGNEKAFPDYVAHLSRLAGNDPRIKIMGRYNNEQVANIISQFNALVIPSMWNEIGPWVMFEALEMKVPVVSTDLPNMSYVIEHGRNGLLFKRGDSKDLLHQLERLINEPTLTPRLIAGIDRVKTIDDELSELEKVYRAIVN
jgi:glycosyltransferase involved in cell wall biosynthesis